VTENASNTPQSSETVNESTVRTLLLAFGAATDDQADDILDRLFADYAQVWCREITRTALRKYSLRSLDREDQVTETEAEVLLRVTGRLRAIRQGAAEPITDLKAYIATCVYNACFLRLRAAAPERTRLENRLRYLLRHDGRFGMWEANGETVAGFEGWRGRAADAEAEAPAYPVRQPDLLLEQIFEGSGGPVTFGALVRITAAALGVADTRPVDYLDSMLVAERQPGADTVFGHAEGLRRLWPEVLALPANQRVALLLNLRDEEGQGVIELIIATGVATFDDLAHTLGMPATELERMWDGLPLEDSQIAEMLGLSRQQVINLRKAARGKLARRAARNDHMGLNSASTSKAAVLGAAGKVVRRLFRGGNR
jgi:DNA-directed RNA polymerase specialized sigma24 family protein